MMAEAKPVLVPDVSQRDIDIGYSFSGADLLLFGAILYPGGRLPTDQKPADIVIVEGYKREGHRKIEARRRGAKSREPLSPNDANIIAVAADHPQPAENLPVFDLDDIAAIADFAERVTGLKA